MTAARAGGRPPRPPRLGPGGAAALPPRRRRPARRHGGRGEPAAAPAGLSAALPDRVVFALTGPAGEEEALLDYVEALGRRADALARQDPLPSPSAPWKTLQAVPPRRPAPSSPPSGCSAWRPPPPAPPPSPAAWRSTRATSLPSAPSASPPALSSAARELTVDDVRERVKSRYPEAPELPGRTRLDDLVREVLGLEWDSTARDGQGAYPLPRGARPPSPRPPLHRASAPRSPRTRPRPTSAPEVVDARIFEDRLQRADREGAFLALLVADEGRSSTPSRELARRFPVEPVSLEALWIDAMREPRLSATASTGISCCAPTPSPPATPTPGASPASWTRRWRPSRPASPRRREPSSSPAPVCWPATIRSLSSIAYGSASRAVRPRARPGLHGLWVLVPSDGSTERPRLTAPLSPRHAFANRYAAFPKPGSTTDTVPARQP